MAVVRFTKQRQAVLEAVRHTDCHPDAAWVHARVRQVLPHISLGTVYRSLEALVEEGHLVSILGAGDSKRFDYRSEGHHHLICKRCSKIFDVSLESLPTVKLMADHLPPGFEVEDVVLEFHGVCGGCRDLGN